MKFFPLLASLAVAATICTSAVATPITYSFAGTLTDIRGTGAGILFGTAFTASYVHDDTPQTGSAIEPNRQLYSGGRYSISAGTLALVGSPSSELQVFDNWSNSTGGYNQDDGYFVSSFIYDSTGFYLIQFDMWDMTGSALSSLSMPTQSQFQQLAGNGRVLIRRFDNGIETGLALGTFGSVTSQDVPEPSSLALALASMLLLGASQRRAAGGA